MYYEAGVELYKQNKIDDAVNILKEALKYESEERVGACYYLASCHEGMEKEEYLLKAMCYDEPRPEICCELAMSYMDRKLYAEAIPLLLYSSNKKRVNEYAFFIEDYWKYIPYLELSVCYDRLNQIEKANVYNELAAMVYPNAKSVLYNREYFESLLKAQGSKSIEEEKKEIIKRRAKYKDVKMDAVSMITVTNKLKYIENIFENYNRITYPKKELILILNSNKLDIQVIKEKEKEDSSIHVYQLDEQITLGECLNYGIGESAYDYIAKIDDDDYYGKNYLLDAIIDSKEYGIDVIVKSRRLILLEQENRLYIYRGLGENTVVMGGAGGTIVAKKSVFSKLLFHAKNVAEDEEFFQDCRRQGIAVYSGARFNYIYKRHCSMEDHSYVVADQHFKTYSIPVEVTTTQEDYAEV